MHVEIMTKEEKFKDMLSEQSNPCVEGSLNQLCSWQALKVFYRTKGPSIKTTQRFLF